MSPLAILRRKWESIESQLKRDDVATVDKSILIAQRALDGLGLAGQLDVRRHEIFEMRQAPSVMRGLRDLEIRLGDTADIDAVCAVNGARSEHVAARLERGDQMWVGALAGRILCHVFFHRGPAPFVEDEPKMARWALDDDEHWSYDAATTLDSRASGVFVKLFQTALAAVFTEQGAKRVLCRIDMMHTGSIALHKRLGFSSLGLLLTVSTPLANVLAWRGRRPQTLVLRKSLFGDGDTRAMGFLS